MDIRVQLGMADARLTFRHGVEIPKRRCFETLLRSLIRNTHVTWLRRFEASGRVTSVSRRGIPADSVFDWQGREQITQLHICLNVTPTKYKSGANTSSLWVFFQRLEKFYIYVKKRSRLSPSTAEQLIFLNKKNYVKKNKNKTLWPDVFYCLFFITKITYLFTKSSFRCQTDVSTLYKNRTIKTHILIVY